MTGSDSMTAALAASCDHLETWMKQDFRIHQLEAPPLVVWNALQCIGDLLAEYEYCFWSTGSSLEPVTTADLNQVRATAMLLLAHFCPASHAGADGLAALASCHDGMHADGVSKERTSWTERRIRPLFCIAVCVLYVHL